MDYDYTNPRILPDQSMKRERFQEGEPEGYVLIGVVNGERRALSVGDDTCGYFDYDDALGWLDNWARPDGPLQNKTFSACGVRALSQSGTVLWDEIHYRDERDMRGKQTAEQVHSPGQPDGTVDLSRSGVLASG